jgi:hypothetical protein
MEVVTSVHHVLAAADKSEAGRQAVRTSIDLAVRARASVTVMNAIPVRARKLFHPAPCAALTIPL